MYSITPGIDINKRKHPNTFAHAPSDSHGVIIFCSAPRSDTQRTKINFDFCSIMIDIRKMNLKTVHGLAAIGIWNNFIQANMMSYVQYAQPHVRKIRFQTTDQS